ncbi:photosynthetic complex assembly protein PuhC [Litoreibacter roseus]|uniref:Photosynthetic complex assembly protein n=1 Tax=Litoreibacter roseus TaxID=2601869 RepID=A0A6N6JFS4_9RHOB|nr:photosynthetic complex assembly protein PuhC [Litoreibacter roseus]GFE64640.1 hypothetical protein KIN_17140 [Litoreibacter roseus]
MSEQQLIDRDREMIPTFLLRAMLGVVVAIFALAAFASFTDRPLEAMPPEVPVIQSRDIVIHATMSGAVRVTDTSGAVIADLAPEEGGFIAGVGRVLERERAKIGITEPTAIKLIKYENGRLALRDDFTTWRAELQGFGQTNEAAFHKLLK